MPELPPLDVPIAVIFHAGRLLISQRLPGDSFGGFWEFPGGKRDAGETMELCLAREIREELGAELDRLAFPPAGKRLLLKLQEDNVRI